MSLILPKRLYGVTVGKYHVTLSQCHNGVTDGHVTQVTVTRCHMTRVI